MDWNVKGNSRILQNAMNILQLKTYEVPYARTKGLDGSIIDMPINLSRPLIEADIEETLELREPRVSVSEIEHLEVVDGDIKTKVVLTVD